MVIKLSKPVTSWTEATKFLVNNISTAKRGHGGYYFNDVVIEDFSFNLDPFATCFYRNPKGKMSTLRKQYLNQESLHKIFEDKVVTVSMVGGPKWGTTAGNKHCMASLQIDHTNKTVEVYFRNSDFFKKFLVDIYFVEEILKEVGVTGYKYSCHFTQLTLRTPFTYIYLEQVFKGAFSESGEEEVKAYLSSNNPLIKDFLDYYKGIQDKKISWKSLERAQRVMRESASVYKIIEPYLGGTK